MQIHPCADIWPLMTDAQLDELAADIAANGQILPIMTLDGMILDGRNRWLACERAGVEPWLQAVETDDPDAVAWSLNEHRRHASESVRGLAARRRETLGHGGARRGIQDANLHLGRAEIARRFGVSPRTVANAATVIDHGDQALIDAVESDDVAVSLAAKAVRHMKETGEGFASIADLKNTMRAIYREENPLPPALPKSTTSPASHVSVDTFGVVAAVVRHASTYPVTEAAAEIDKWSRLNILDDLPPAITYLTELKDALITREQTNADALNQGRGHREDPKLARGASR
jgi:hypothetical protein